MPNILYIDVDSLRPDHLGCYGYDRPTSPNIDALAADGILFTGVHASDTPCLPSRTALWSGRFGLVTGVVGHGGTVCEPRRQGETRAWAGTFLDEGLTGILSRMGWHCATISSFAERHGAWHWLAGWAEVQVPRGRGHELAEEVSPRAIDFIKRHAGKGPWFLHVNLWDAHTPYRTPESFGRPFDNAPLPAWLTEDVIAAQLGSYGPHSAAEPLGWGTEPLPLRAPDRIEDLGAAQAWFAGYDTGIAYADHHIGRILAALDATGQAGDTIVVVSADHGENLGELNIWGDHQTADAPTCNVPLVIRWPGAPGFRGRNDGLHYHFDWVATLLDRLGAEVPDVWHARSFAADLDAGRDGGRAAVVMGQGAWSAQRGVRWREGARDWLLLRTYDAGLKPLPPILLFDLATDPAEQTDLAAAHPDAVGQGLTILDTWLVDTMAAAGIETDPMMTMIAEGGPYHVQNRTAAYLDRLRATGRGHHADAIQAEAARFAHRR